MYPLPGYPVPEFICPVFYDFRYHMRPDQLSPYDFPCRNEIRIIQIFIRRRDLMGFCRFLALTAVMDMARLSTRFETGSFPAVMNYFMIGRHG